MPYLELESPCVLVSCRSCIISYFLTPSCLCARVCVCVFVYFHGCSQGERAGGAGD
jgi:hypothetical protein